MSDDTQGAFIGDILEPESAIVVNDDCPPGLAVLLYPGARIRMYADPASGRLEAINVVHETVEPDGSRRIHENDYFLTTGGRHIDFIQQLGRLS